MSGSKTDEDLLKQCTLQDLQLLRETVDLELKAAQGSAGLEELPQDFWETYSAMANTEGGHILLGIREAETGRLEVLGIRKPEPVLRALWDNASDPKQISINRLAKTDVQVIEVEGKNIVDVHVPRAGREQRPVYVGSDPLAGTYRRNDEGDYRCPEDVTRHMLAEGKSESADQDVSSADHEILEGFGLEDLDENSLVAYRNEFRSTNSGHRWLRLGDKEFLVELGAFRHDRKTGNEGLTRAGLLMFGRYAAIHDALPAYLVDFREESPEWSGRYRDRITTDGTWSGNLYDFYCQVYPKLVTDLKVPFAYREDFSRLDDTQVHKAVREALVNAIIHADYMGSIGIRILKAPHRLRFRNPGGLRIPLDQVLAEEKSDCRNKNLQRMFQRIGASERAGQGLVMIFAAWRDEDWRKPLIREEYQPDCTELALTMESLFPEASLVRLEKKFGTEFRQLGKYQRLAMTTALVEGRIDQRRLRDLSDLPAGDVVLLLKDLADRNMLTPRGVRRGRYYALPETESSGGRTGPPQDSVPPSDQLGITRKVDGWRCPCGHENEVGDMRCAACLRHRAQRAKRRQRILVGISVGLVIAMILVIGFLALLGKDEYQGPLADICRDGKLSQEERQLLPPFRPIEQKAYPVSVPEHLVSWVNRQRVRIDEPFEIMGREVTTSDFRILDGGVRSDEVVDSQVLSSVEWTDAQKFAQRLADISGCQFRLPTHEQWLAAVIEYAKPEEAILASTSTEKPVARNELPDGQVSDLLGNLREWSRESCKGKGHFLLGEDYLTKFEHKEGEPLCRSRTTKTIGFRLVLEGRPE